MYAEGYKKIDCYGIAFYRKDCESLVWQEIELPPVDSERGEVTHVKKMYNFLEKPER